MLRNRYDDDFLIAVNARRGDRRRNLWRLSRGSGSLCRMLANVAAGLMYDIGTLNERQEPTAKR